MEDSKRSSVVPIGADPRLSETNARLLEYWLMFRPRIRLIAAVTLAAVVLTFILTEFVMSPWYQAEAVIRPGSQEGPTSPTANWKSSSAGSALAALGAATGLGQAIPSDASEFMLMMKSFDFTTELIRRHHLEPIIDHKGHYARLMDLLFGSSNAAHTSDEQKWARYKEMGRRFQEDYDDKLGNLTLTIVDRNRDTARQMLGYYIEDLRDVIRNRALHDTATAVSSLEEELDKTPDPLIRTQLARLVAQQIAQEKMAQAQADFAFTVVQPPYSRIHRVRPNTLIDCVMMALIVPLVFMISIIFYHRVYAPIRDTQASSGGRGDLARSEQERISLAASKR